MGHPKAVMLSHDNLTHDSKLVVDAVKLLEDGETIVSFLPLSHVAAQVINKFINYIII